MFQEHIIKIGTRESPLAQWQARKVQTMLSASRQDSVLVPVASTGDQDLVTPLYAMGVQGVFTRHLDAHLLNGDIDIAVHSMKDVPTQLAQGLVQVAVLPRASTADLLVLKKDRWHFSDGRWEYTGPNGDAFKIGTGSVRRTAEWLHRYPNSKVVNLRGNVQTRLRKLRENDWDGAIFAAAGLERMDLMPDEAMPLDWMLPAPAQGAIVVICRRDDDRIFKICHQINDADTALCVRVERDFLSTLMGGCSTPIGALATLECKRLLFRGNILSPDGRHASSIKEYFDWENALTAGVNCADRLLLQGAGKIIEEIRNFEKKH